MIARRAVLGGVAGVVCLATVRSVWAHPSKPPPAPGTLVVCANGHAACVAAHPPPRRADWREGVVPKIDGQYARCALCGAALLVFHGCAPDARTARRLWSEPAAMAAAR